MAIAIPNPPRLTGDQTQDARIVLDYLQDLAKVLEAMEVARANHETRIAALEVTSADHETRITALEP